MTSLYIPYPDVEQAVMDILLPLGPVVSWLPPEFEPPLQHVQRIGGGPDVIDVTDYALIRVSFYGETRNAAWALAGLGEQMILSHRGREVNRPGRPTHGMQIDSADLDVGGTLDPDLDPDDRRVTKNFVVGMRRQYHLVGA